MMKASTTKKYNLALFGTFDLENFGDILFPNVFEKNIGDRLKIDNLVLFSPMGGKKPFEEDRDVYAVSDFDRLNEKYRFDAVIVGGGDLLRLDGTVVYNDSYRADNPALDFFVMPSVYAQKYNIPLIYNAPGAPFEFNDAQKTLAGGIADTVSYFSVRDSRSERFFKSCDGTLDITVAPDSVISIASLYSFDELKPRFNGFAADYSLKEDKYIVFQCVSAVFKENEDVIAGQLDAIAEKSGCDVVFMPITYVHNDGEVMESIFGKMKSPAKKFVNEHLSPFEMCALLSRSKGYIGSSLHGGIVSLAYKRSATALNLFGLSKLTGIYQDFGLSKNVAVRAEDIADVFFDSRALSDEELGGLIKSVGAHFDKIASCIESGETKPATLLGSIITDYYKLLAVNALNLHTPSCTVYFGRGGAFSEFNKVTLAANKISGRKFEIEFDVPEDADSLRFDPDEGYPCIVRHPYIETDCAVTELQCINGIDCKDMYFFNTTDPQFFSEIGAKGRLKIAFEYIPVVSSEYISAFSSMSKELEARQSDFDAHTRHEEKIRKLENENKELSGAVAEKNQKIDELHSEIRKLENENKKLSGAVAEKSQKIDELHSDIQELRTSFCWRITAPIRAVSDFRLKCIKGFYYLRRNGVKATLRRLMGGAEPVRESSDGLDVYNKIPDSLREKQEKRVFKKNIKFSVIVPLYNTPQILLREMIESVEAQTYKNWELCLADGSDGSHGDVEATVKKYADKDGRIIYKRLSENLGISENTNACIGMATGDYIALFDHDDLLHPCALYEYMKVITERDADFIYCDEDKFEKLGKGFYDAHYKPDFAIDNLRANNYICHFTVFDRKLLDIVGGFRKEFDGSQDHDMILRLTEQAKSIVHVPKVLYHWRISDVSVASDPYAKPYTITAGINAVSEHLQRVGLSGTVESTKVHPNIYRIKYDIIDNPKVSVLIPNYNHVAELSTCINSILEKSTYDNYEIIIIENNSDSETFDYYNTLKDNPKIKVVVYNAEGGFNYSAINNYGAEFATGEHILLLNNDVEVIAPEWIEEMLMFSQRSDVGAVGAKLYYPDDTIQHAGVILGLLKLAGHAFRGMPREYAGYFGRASFQQDLTACTAACLMLPKRVFDEVGGFDEKFAVAFNDIDLCMKIRSKGYNIVFTPFAELYHYESKSRGIEDTPEKVKRFQGEIQRFYDKWQPELDAGDPYYNPNLTLDREDFSQK